MLFEAASDAMLCFCTVHMYRHFIITMDTRTHLVPNTYNVVDWHEARAGGLMSLEAMLPPLYLF